jgi:nuclear transport factor 2 (NTF2) superfamily protein
VTATPQKSRLLDARALVEEYGFSQETAYKLMREIGHVDGKRLGIRKLWVWRDDVEERLREATVRPR